MNINLDTIVVYVNNISNLKPFYLGVLKLQIVEEYEAEWLLLKAGNCNIGLHRMGEQYRVDIPDGYKFDNNTKLVFEIDENINQFREYLLANNVMVREIKTFDNYNFWLFDGEDPEGNVFQIKQKKK